MVTGELKSQVDKIWNAFWTGGISNPLTVIEQFTYLLFIRRLDEIQLLEEKKANMISNDIKDPIFTQSQKPLRWNVFKNNDPETMFDLFTKPQVEPPFTDVNDQGLLGVFDDALATKVIKLIDKVNNNALTQTA